MIIAGHFNEPDTYNTHRPSGMEDALLFYTLEGSGYLITPQGKRQTNKGDLAFLQANIPHRYGTVRGNNWNFMWVHVPDSGRYFHLPSEEITIWSSEYMSDHNRIYQSFQMILQDSREQRGLWKELCENTIQQLLLLMNAGKRRKIDPRVEQTLRLISHGMDEPIRIRELADAVNLSESRLSHLFKEEMGETIVTAVNKMRIKQAALYIAHTGRTATQSAYDVGFHNYNHFSKLFRQYMGMSPSAYAKKEKR